MRLLLVRLLLATLCLFAGSSRASLSDLGDTIGLADSMPSTVVTTDIQTWIDVGSHATIDKVAGTATNFRATPALGRHPLSKNDTLWIKLSLMRAPGSAGPWTLNLPTPSLDSITLYQPNGTGAWIVQRAGDTMAQSGWHRPGLYPDFDLNMTDPAKNDIYLAVRNYKPAAVPLRISPQLVGESQRQRELLGVALMLGALLCMVALSMLRFVEHRKGIDGLAVLFGLLIVVTVAQFDGVMSAFVWGAYPKFGDIAASILPVGAVGCTLLFVRSIFAQPSHWRWFDRITTWLGVATVASVLLVGVLDRQLADKVCGGAMLIATVLALISTFLGWRTGSQLARWLMIAMVPQFIGQIYIMASGFDLVPFVWEMRYLTSLAIAMAVPVLMYALNELTHDRKELVVRANHLPTQDALTGLLTKEVFQRHLEDSVARAVETREPIALVLVRVINHQHIRETCGDTIAEQCLLRAVVKLQRILRDVDPAGRVGTSQFALLMEGVRTPEALTKRMVKLIASGLIPLPGLVPEVPLHFQAACVLLHNNPIAPERVLGDLRDLLGDMSSRTRRPIRFLEALPTQASSLHSQGQTEPA